MNIGRYTAKAIDFGFGVTANGNEFVAVLFETQDGETIAWQGHFNDKCVDRTVQSLKTLGWDGADITALSIESLSNRVSIVVGEDMYNGERQMKVRWINPERDLGIREPLPAARLQAIAARLQRANAPKPIRQVKPKDEDDLPF